MSAGVSVAIRKVGHAAWAAGAALVVVLRELLGGTAEAAGETDRQLHDTDLIGEYNHRTGRLDAGNDPYGWYDED